MFLDYVIPAQAGIQGQTAGLWSGTTAMRVYPGQWAKWCVIHRYGSVSYVIPAQAGIQGQTAGV